MGRADLSAVARRAKADVAQLAERVLGKDEVTSSILVIGSILRSRMQAKDAHHRSRSERRWASRQAAVSYGWQAKPPKLRGEGGQHEVSSEEQTQSSLLERAHNAYGEREI